MKNLKVLMVLLCVICLSPSSFVQADTNLFNQKSEIVSYSNDFDVLLLDFVLTNPDNSDDVLEAITLKNEGDSSYEFIDNLNLWVDDGIDGFQGMTLDKKIGEFQWGGQRQGWYLKNLSQSIIEDGTRLFVSADFNQLDSSTSEINFDVKPHSYFDANNNNKHDFEDFGIFLQSGKQAVTTKVHQYNSINVKDNKNILGPRIEASNVINEGVIAINDSFSIKGVAKDRQNGSVKSMEIQVSVDNNSGAWIDLDISNVNDDKVISWEHSLNNIQFGKEYTISVRGIDFGNNQELKVYQVIFVKIVIEEPETSEKNQEQILSLENSVLLANRPIGLRGPIMEDDLYVKAILRDQANKPIVGKRIDLTASRTGKTFEMTLQTNEEGESVWKIESTVNDTFEFEAKVDGLILKEKPTIKFIDASLQGQLIKGESSSAVYLLKEDNKRYVFPNQSVYYSYYNDFSSVKVIKDSELAEYMIGGNITYRTGSLIKIPSINNVYFVGENNVIDWIESEVVAKRMFGAAWSSLVHDVSDSFFVDYKIGSSLK